MRVADFIVNTIYEAGVEECFLVTGRGALFLNDALAKHDHIKAVPVHHEQSAGFAAVAYADQNESIGACMVSTGCAATNTLTAVLNAWQDGIPCIFISGQNKLNETTNHTGLSIRTYGQQEADIIPIVQSITKYSVMLKDSTEVKYHLDKALHLATTGRKGPVWIDIPLDVQNMRINLDDQKSEFVPDKNNGLPEVDSVDEVWNLINIAERPVILIGNGVRSAGAVDLFHEFVNKYQIPVVYSGSAVDIYGTTNELSIGSVGIMGCSRAGNFTMQNSDLLLVIGNRLTSMTTGEQLEKFARQATIISVDIDETEHKKEGLNIDHFVHCDAKLFLEKIMDRKPPTPNKAWIEKSMHWKSEFAKIGIITNKQGQVDLYDLSRSFSKVLPEEATIVTDSGLIELIIPTNTDFKKSQRCIHPASQGSMGYALPAVIGTHFASKGLVVCVVGDGSIMMNLQELATIKYQDIPAKIFVVNNNAYAVIRKRQIELFRNRTIGVDDSDGVGIPEFENIAKGFGIGYAKIEDCSNLDKKIGEVLNMEGPVLCEIMGLEEQNYISVSHTRANSKRFVQRPLEDQSPFLEREFFENEMIIEPIDQ